MQLTDEPWAVLEPLIPVPTRREDGKGRPWRDHRAGLEGMLWILRTGAPWQDLPERYPPYQPCHRWFQPWTRTGVIERLLRALAEDVRERGGWISPSASSTGPLSSRKRGPRGGKHQAGQRSQAHGRGGPRGSSCRRLRGQGYAA